MTIEVGISGGLVLTVEYKITEDSGVEFKIKGIEGRMIGKSENTWWLERRMTERDYNRIINCCQKDFEEKCKV